jgi:hypothetical protein
MFTSKSKPLTTLRAGSCWLLLATARFGGNYFIWGLGPEWPVGWKDLGFSRKYI